MRKITIVSIYYPPEKGAAAARIAQMAKGLRAQNMDVNVISALPNYPTGRIFPEYQGRIIYSELIDTIPVKRYWLYPSNSAMAIKRIINMASFSLTLFLSLPHQIKIRPDLLIVNSPPLPVGFAGVLLAKILRAKLITNVSDIWPLSALEMGAIRRGWFYSLLEKIEGFVYRFSDGIMAQSEQTRAHVRIRDPDKNVLLYRNLDYVSKFIDQYPKLDEQPLKIVYAGLLGVAQGVYDICNAVDFTRLGAEFHLYGDGNEREKISQLIAHNPNAKIFLHETVPKPDIPSILAEYHATIIPLRREIHGAFPSKIYMAIAASLPILFCGDGEGADFVHETKIGWVSPSGDYQKLGENIQKLSQMGMGDYQSLREKIKHLAENRFDLDKQLDELVDFIEQISH